jgi:phosphoglycolate phosphatase-like HAD superfamily hydrolase
MQPANQRERKQLRPISAALGISKSVDILHHIRSLPSAEEQLEASKKIKAIEREAMHHQKPQPGLVELMDYLQSREIKRALCTRNFEYVIFSSSFSTIPYGIRMGGLRHSERFRTPVTNLLQNHPSSCLPAHHH